MKWMGLLPMALALAVTGACDARNDASLRDQPEAVGTAGTAATDNDRVFIERMLDANMAEVELGQMAQNKASSADVKQFATMMVRDHSRGLDLLKTLASKQGIPLVAQLDEKHKDLRDRLSKLRGEEFDREYMNAMVDGHEDVIDQLQTRANEDRFGENKGTVKAERGDNPVAAGINNWAATTLPTTRQHLEEARRINGILGNRLTRKQ